MNNSKINNKSLNSSLIDFLIKKYKNTTIHTNLTFKTTFDFNQTDILLVNNHTYSFVIINDLHDYKNMNIGTRKSEIFDYSYFVYIRDKFNKIPLSFPENIGVIEAYWDDKKNNIKFVVLKKAKKNKIQDLKSITSLLSKVDLLHILKTNDKKVFKSYTRDELINQFLENFTHVDILKFFRGILKCKKGNIECL